MAISETTLKDTILFLIEEQNKKGGVNGKPIRHLKLDDGYDPKKAVAALEGLVERGERPLHRRDRGGDRQRHDRGGHQENAHTFGRPF